MTPPLRRIDRQESVRWGRGAGRRNRSLELAVPVACPIAQSSVLIAGFLTFLSRVFEKSSSRRLFQKTPPSAGSETAQRLAAADLAGQLPQASHEPGHTAEAARSRLPRPPLASSRLPHRWHPSDAGTRSATPATDPAARRTGRAGEMEMVLTAILGFIMECRETPATFGGASAWSVRHAGTPETG
jgi:hypothetical protein